MPYAPKKSVLLWDCPPRQKPGRGPALQQPSARFELEIPKTRTSTFNRLGRNMKNGLHWDGDGVGWSVFYDEAGRPIGQVNRVRGSWLCTDVRTRIPQILGSRSTRTLAKRTVEDYFTAQRAIALAEAGV